MDKEYKEIILFEALRKNDFYKEEFTINISPTKRVFNLSNDVRSLQFSFLDGESIDTVEITACIQKKLESNKFLSVFELIYSAKFFLYLRIKKNKRQIILECKEIAIERCDEMFPKIGDEDSLDKLLHWLYEFSDE